jgi:hypothetical protein
MSEASGTSRIHDGDPISADDIPGALTAAPLVYDDGSTQIFELDGETTFFEHGSPTRGEWSVDGSGHFTSFWPPTYRASYELRWIVESGKTAGVLFAEIGSGQLSRGRYQAV